MTTDGDELPQLDLYDIAFLAGDAERVVDTALVALVESGRIRVHAPGELAVVEPGRHHPVEAALMDAVGTRGHRSVDMVRWRLAGDERLLGLGRSLAAAGLLRRRLRVGRNRPRPLWRTTTSGRRVLRLVADRPPADPTLDGGSAFQVALHGRPALTDGDLRVAIFERPSPPSVPDGLGQRLRNADHVDPSTAAHLTRGIGFGGGGG
jgi:hypothetical protein